MPGTAVGLFVIDFVARPVAKIYEKMPIVMLLAVLFLYGVIAYFVLKSAFLASEHQ
jgi:hypothetical protein